MFIGVVFALFFNLSSIYAVNKPIEDKYLEYKQNVSPNHYKLIETQYSQLKRDQQQEIKKRLLQHFSNHVRSGMIDFSSIQSPERIRKTLHNIDTLNKAVTDEYNKQLNNLLLTKNNEKNEILFQKLHEYRAFYEQLFHFFETCSDFQKKQLTLLIALANDDAFIKAGRIEQKDIFIQKYLKNSDKSISSDYIKNWIKYFKSTNDHLQSQSDEAIIFEFLNDIINAFIDHYLVLNRLKKDLDFKLNLWILSEKNLPLKNYKTVVSNVNYRYLSKFDRYFNFETIIQKVVMKIKKNNDLEQHTMPMIDKLINDSVNKISVSLPIIRYFDSTWISIQQLKLKQLDDHAIKHIYRQVDKLLTGKPPFEFELYDQEAISEEKNELNRNQRSVKNIIFQNKRFKTYKKKLMLDLVLINQIKNQIESIQSNQDRQKSASDSNFNDRIRRINKLSEKIARVIVIIDNELAMHNSYLIMYNINKKKIKTKLFKENINKNYINNLIVQINNTMSNSLYPGVDQVTYHSILKGYQDRIEFLDKVLKMFSNKVGFGNRYPKVLITRLLNDDYVAFNHYYHYVVDSINHKMNRSLIDSNLSEDDIVNLLNVTKLKDFNFPYMDETYLKVTDQVKKNQQKQFVESFKFFVIQANEEIQKIDAYVADFNQTNTALTELIAEYEKDFDWYLLPKDLAIKHYFEVKNNQVTKFRRLKKTFVKEFELTKARLIKQEKEIEFLNNKPKSNLNLQDKSRPVKLGDNEVVKS